MQKQENLTEWKSEKRKHGKLCSWKVDREESGLSEKLSKLKDGKMADWFHDAKHMRI